MQLNLILLLSLAVSVLDGAKEASENNTFVATNEWQEIKEGQGIPAGLHVRINLQTGKKEAKLLDEDGEQQAERSQGSNALSKGPESDSGSSADQGSLSDPIERLQRNSMSAVGYSAEHFEKITRAFKSYNELKKTYEEMRKKFKTDGEIVMELLSEFRNLSTRSDEELPLVTKVETQQRILDNLDNLMHQIDNALLFVDHGGLNDVLLPMIANQTDVMLRVRAIRILGAITQNNPKAQVKAYEANFGPLLAQILMSSTNTEELSVALYAFGSLLRKFPYAQQRLLSTVGAQALVSLLAKECELKIKAKVATFISDVVYEKELVLSKRHLGDTDPLAIPQYEQLQFPEWFQTNGYCEAIDTLLSDKLYEFLEQPDIAEYFVQAMVHTSSFCQPFWSQRAELRHALLVLRNRYNQSKEEYRMELAQQIDKVVEALYSQAHDEL